MMTTIRKQMTRKQIMPMKKDNHDQHKKEKQWEYKQNDERREYKE